MTLWDVNTSKHVVTGVCSPSHTNYLHELIFFSFVTSFCWLQLVSYPLCLSLFDHNKSKRNRTGRKPLSHLLCCGGSTIISHLKTVAYLAVQLHRSKRWPNYSITPSLMVSMAARCIFPRDAPWRNECLINHHPGNNTPSSLCRMCQTLTRTLGEISLPVQPQPLIWT